MKSKHIAVALAGNGAVVELLAKRIHARKDLQLATTVTDAAAMELPADIDCVVYVPDGQALADGSAAAHVAGWLRAGCNVVSTAPAEALGGVDLRAACREGQSTFHGTGGYQSRLVSRFNRAFASITRNLRDVELVEEREVAELPAEDAAACEGFYAAGLHTLADAVFGDDLAKEPVTSVAARARGDDLLRSRVGKAQPAGEQLIVRRTLGEHVAYDSVLRQQENSKIPLRYRLNTRSSDAIGHVTIEFHAGSGIDPADHLACGGVLDAIRPVCEARSGILRHELGINQVQLNECLAP